MSRLKSLQAFVVLVFSISLGLMPSTTVAVEPYGVSYASYIGGGVEDAAAVATDAAGNIYVAGTTWSDSFPTTKGVFQGGRSAKEGESNSDGFIVKLDPTGQKVLFATLLGGNGRDVIWDIQVDAQGNSYVLGYTEASDFPTTEGVYRREPPQSAENSEKRSGSNKTDQFVAKLNADGSELMYSTLLGVGYPGGGGAEIGALALNSRDEAIVTGRANKEFYVPKNTSYSVTESDRPERNFDGMYVIGLNTQGTDTTFGAFFIATTGYAIEVDAQGTIYALGSTQVRSIPEIEALEGVSSETVMVKLSPDGREILQSTYLPADNGLAFGAGDIAVGDDGRIYVVGNSDYAELPTTPAAVQATRRATVKRNSDLQPEGNDPSILYGKQDAYLLVLAPGGKSVEYFTYLGADGPLGDTAESVSIGDDGTITVAGSVHGLDFPLGRSLLASEWYQVNNANAFVSIFGSDFALQESLIFGGMGGDTVRSLARSQDGSIIAYGETGDDINEFMNDFPLVKAVQSKRAGTFLTMLKSGVPAIPATTSTGDSLYFYFLPAFIVLTIAVRLWRNRQQRIQASEVSAATAAPAGWWLYPLALWFTFFYVFFLTLFYGISVAPQWLVDLNRLGSDVPFFLPTIALGFWYMRFPRSSWAAFALTLFGIGSGAWELVGPLILVTYVLWPFLVLVPFSLITGLQIFRHSSR